MERKSRLIDALENAAWRSGSTFTHELANKRAIRCSSILLPRIEDAALKFRGCFQAICELRSENQQGEDQRVVCTSRQGVVVLEPIYPTSLLRHISLSHPPALSLPFSLCPNFPSLSLPLSLPRYGSPSATLCLLCIRRRRETNSYLFMSFRFILARPLRKKKNRSRNNLERRDIHIIEKLLHEDILSRSISLYFQCNYIIVCTYFQKFPLLLRPFGSTIISYARRRFLFEKKNLDLVTLV